MKTIRTAINTIITFLLGILGLSSCGGGLLAMYGVPVVALDVTGQVTDSLGHPLRGIEVTGPAVNGNYKNSSLTDSDGRFALTIDAFGGGYLFLKDLSTDDGCYMPDTVEIKDGYEVKPAGAWRSEGSVEGVQVTLREAELDEYRATLDIMGSWTEVTLAESSGKVVWQTRSYEFASDGSVKRTTDGVTEEGTFTYNYRTLVTSLAPDSLKYIANNYRYRVWRRGNEVVMWTPSFVHFDTAERHGYFFSVRLTENGRIEEELEIPGRGYMAPVYFGYTYEGNKIIKSEMIEGHCSFVPYTDAREGGTLIFTSYDGKKEKRLEVASISKYGMAVGEKAPYQFFVRAE